MPILSIVVPSYNTARFIDECVPSFLDSRFDGIIIVFFVDDGSTDDTGSRLVSYQNKAPNIIRYIKKPNGGHGSVINYAVQNLISTKYFKIVDGDDWVDPTELLNLALFLEEHDFDIVINDYINVFPDATSYCKSFCPSSEGSYKGYHLTIHSLTYKTAIFKTHEITLRERVFYEDNEYVLFPLEFEQSIGYFPRAVYYYRLGRSEQSVSIKTMLKRAADYQLVKGDILDKYLIWKKERIPNQDLLSFAEYSLSCFYLWTFESMVILKKKRSEIKGILKKELSQIPNVLERLKREKAFRFISSTDFHFLAFKRMVLKWRLKL